MRQTTAKDLSGSMVALVTPMDSTGDINHTQWQKLIQWHISCGTRAIVVAGTTGESALLSETEVTALTTAAVDLCKDSDTRVIVGTGAIRPEQVIKTNQTAQELGADAALVVTPYYLTLTQQALVAHFTGIAEATDIPIILYNVPGRTGTDLQSNTTARLAKLPSVIGIKEAKADMQRIRELVAIKDFAVLSGDDGTFVEAMGLGAQGVISVAANVRPAAIKKMCDHCLLGHQGEAQSLNQQVAPLYDYLFHEPNPCPVKALMHATDMIDAGIRAPLMLTEMKSSELKKFNESIRQETHNL